MLAGLVAGLWLTPVVAQPAGKAETVLQGTWVATSSERDGAKADDVVGHRLSFAGPRFQIRARDGKLLYEGTFKANPTVRPASIDFHHVSGTSKGNAWKGIYALEEDTLRICDNAPDPTRDRPTRFDAKAGSGHVCIVFERTRS
jgi:uncharacterized protein (TIGR03067 family)